MDKTLPDLAAAVAGIEDGSTVMIGGLFAAWLSDNLHVSADELVEHCVGMIVGSATYPTRT